MLSNKLEIEDVKDQLSGKRVLMRVDFNVPLKDGVVSSDLRIVQAMATVKMALDSGAQCVILMSHLGRPDGQNKPEFSLKPVVPVLTKCLPGVEVVFLDNCVGPDVEKACESQPKGTVVLLENLRFHIEEEGNGVDNVGKKVKADAEDVKHFRESLSKLGDIFINDAFGTAHRPHSSMVGVNLPIKAAGLLMKKELAYFSVVLESPMKPFVAILGGAKVKDKIQLIKNMLDKVNIMIIVGGMAFTFKKVLNNMPIGNSLFDDEGAKIVKEIVEEAGKKNVELILPTDFVCSKQPDDSEICECDDQAGIADGYMGLDIGDKSKQLCTEAIKKCKTILWNGPAGVVEKAPFAKGSLVILESVIAATKAGAVSIIGGGDTASFVEGCGKGSEVSHVSTGGGASLELLEGKQLPGVVALSDKAAKCPV